LWFLCFFVDLPIFRSQAEADDTALAEIGQGARGSFGSMELWIEDGDDVRLTLLVRTISFLFCCSVVTS
jgi:hypothetical protein